MENESMKKLLSVAIIGLMAMFVSTTVNAATLSLVGGNVNHALPGNFSAGHLSATGLSVDDLVTTFDSSTPGEGLKLLDTGSVSIRFEYLGSEAGNTNKAFEISAGDNFLFNNKTSSVGDTVDVTLTASGGFLPFSFTTSGGGGQTALNGDIDNPLAIAFSGFSSLFGLTNNSIIALFGDGAGDHDFDDMAIRISVVPLPAALPLYGAGIALLGFIGWRKRKAEAAA